MNTISDDTAPSSGVDELRKIVTSNSIFRHSSPMLMKLSPFDQKLKSLSKMGYPENIVKNDILSKIAIFSNNVSNTLNKIEFMLADKAKVKLISK